MTRQERKKRLPKTRGGLWILIVAAVVLEAISCIMYFTSRAAIRSEAEQRAKTELQKAELEIKTHTVELEAAAKTLAMMARKHLNNPDSVFAATQSVVGAIRNTSSMAVAFVPDFFPGQRYFEACSSRITDDSIFTRQIGSAEHDYTQMEWFKNGFVHDSCWWSEPYLDDSGSKTYVVSCSCPVRNDQGEVVAVVCADLSLDELQHISEYLQVYPNSSYTIRSSEGKYIVPIPDTIAGRKYAIYQEEIDDTGWHIEIIIPEEDLFAHLNRVGIIVSVLMIVGLLLLVFIVYRTGRSLVELVDLSNRQDRIESELGIARDIQMAMLPTRFPPFEDYPNLNAFGQVVPAKEVGGDLFDFYIRENKLLFCIGDVSGKGVPASLVMAMTRSLFRSYTSYLNSPAQIVSQMNNSLSGENDQNMFVTLFLGILDLATGEMQFCNAGHNAPIHLSSASPIALLHCKANIPLGVMAEFNYEEQSVRMDAGDTLFLYTDGLTEAENTLNQQFTEQRVFDRLAETRALSPREMIDQMQQAVTSFVGEAAQSDDLTMFAIRLQSISPKNGHVAPAKPGSLRSSLVMRNDIQQIPTLAEWIDSLELPKELNMPINLALEEAVSNVMLYAYPGKSGRVLVECEKSQGSGQSLKLVFTISDEGIPFDPTQKEDPDLTKGLEERAIGGLGIYLVRQTMDEVHYERKDNKNILTLTKIYNNEHFD